MNIPDFIRDFDPQHWLFPWHTQFLSYFFLRGRVGWNELTPYLSATNIFANISVIWRLILIVVPKREYLKILQIISFKPIRQAPRHVPLRRQNYV